MAGRNRAGKCRRQGEPPNSSLMPRRRKTPTPLDVVVSARVPEAVAKEWRAAATAAGLGLSDWIRQAVDGERVRVSGKPTPRKRPKPAAPSGADPLLLGQLLAISNFVTDVAHAVRTRMAKGEPFLVVEILIMLRVIEGHLHTLAAKASNSAHKVPET